MSNVSWVKWILLVLLVYAIIAIVAFLVTVFTSAKFILALGLVIAYGIITSCRKTPG